MKSVQVTEGVGRVDVRTRDRVRSLLLDLGPSTASAVAAATGLTVAAVRRHLDALIAEGTVMTQVPRLRKAVRGRPARLYALSDAGHAAGPSRYDDLAIAALRFMSPEQAHAFAAERGAALEARYASVRSAADRPGALAEALSADGYAATTGPLGTGVQLCQHHCPVASVASEFPELCEAETTALGHLLDVHVQRLATIAHGDGICTTFIPATPQEAKAHS